MIGHKAVLFAAPVFLAILAAFPANVSAHCDTLDGPVVQDARKAIAARDVAPVLKWVHAQDEKSIRAAFDTLMGTKTTNRVSAENDFFVTLIKIHRAGEGAPFTGLKPAGDVEPAVVEADKALAGGSANHLVKMITGDVVDGIRKRFERAAAAYRHKDDSIAQGREFVEAYVEFTHYIERIHADATGRGLHAGADANNDTHSGRPEHLH